MDGKNLKRDLEKARKLLEASDIDLDTVDFIIKSAEVNSLELEVWEKDDQLPYVGKVDVSKDIAHELAMISPKLIHKGTTIEFKPGGEIYRDEVVSAQVEAIGIDSYKVKSGRIHFIINHDQIVNVL